MAQKAVHKAALCAVLALCAGCNAPVGAGLGPNGAETERDFALTPVTPQTPPSRAERVTRQSSAAGLGPGPDISAALNQANEPALVPLYPNGREIMPRICRATEVTPAVYEQVMGDVQVVQAIYDDTGKLVQHPVYRRAPVPKVVQPRAEITFDALCREDLTPDFVSTLQRALAARGYFKGNVTGRMDGPTTAAILHYQRERGLESGQLSLDTARDLGLFAVERAAAGE